MSTYSSTKNEIKYLVNDFYNGRFDISVCLELCTKHINRYILGIYGKKRENERNKLYSYALSGINKVLEYRQQFPGEYVVFINCSQYDFISDIIAGKKLYETRTKDTLHCLIGKRVYICETGKGKRLVRCTAVISEVITIKDCHTWEMYRNYLSIEPGTEYDWKDDTKVKYLYRLENVHELPAPFVPVDSVMHGRSFMDYVNRF